MSRYYETIEGSNTARPCEHCTGTGHQPVPQPGDTVRLSSGHKDLPHRDCKGVVIHATPELGLTVLWATCDYAEVTEGLTPASLEIVMRHGDDQQHDLVEIIDGLRPELRGHVSDVPNCERRGARAEWEHQNRLGGE